ncbi:hypothetical protein GXW78_23625 [Roseomonas terrae]|jgi:hypothetical protein|uniref:SprT-like domain-containing protein n=1 Tax=Neoroseomonas terrae TaxID=424799 RepID=A0ABS5ENP8_9PROT|nr:hypothetical protein [Neoroseomonas terrae]MBR0652668.1 hypothetical protein [Neoroseomonas terrae]
MTSARDARVYAWENRVVAPRDRSIVPFGQMQALVDHVWAAEGLAWPPRMRPRKASRGVLATGSRLAIEAPESLPSWVLLHEIAHAMTSTADGDGAGHGPDFVGVYVRLLVQHCRLDEELLSETLAADGIAWNRHARVAFVDVPRGGGSSRAGGIT